MTNNLQIDSALPNIFFIFGKIYFRFWQRGRATARVYFLKNLRKNLAVSKKSRTFAAEFKTTTIYESKRFETGQTQLSQA